MHFNKKSIFVILTIIGAILIASLSIVQIRKVNQGLPNVTVVNSYTKDNPAIENGLVITPIKVHIYTLEEYNEAFPELSEYSSLSEDEMADLKGWKMAVFTICYENTASENLVYYPYKFNAEAEYSHWFNGVSPMDKILSRTIAPGEQQEVNVSSAIVVDSIIRDEWFNQMSEDIYSLVYKYYPERKELVFPYE